VGRPSSGPLTLPLGEVSPVSPDRHQSGQGRQELLAGYLALTALRVQRTTYLMTAKSSRTRWSPTLFPSTEHGNLAIVSSR
jgi:hypothetical protein